MNPEVLRLWRTRPFQIAAIWEALCIVAGLVGFYRLGAEAFLVAGILVGAAPMGVVMYRFIRSQKADGRASRSGGIVQ